MAKQVFSKRPLTVSDQIVLLKSRGLAIPDVSRAEKYLANISYYRLSGYMYPFLDDPVNHRFKAGACFDDALNLYKADRELRLLVFATLEKIEVAVRARIADEYAVASADPFWYEKAAFFQNSGNHSILIKNIKDSVGRSTDTFVKHFFNVYSNPNPPAWITFEVLPMGQLSILFRNLASSPEKKAIAAYFGLKETVFVSWLHSLVYVRNICAHHARLWNKDFRVSARIPQKPFYCWPIIPVQAERKAYIVLAILNYLLNVITPGHHFKQKLKNIFSKYSVMSLQAMGFPQDWENDPFWA
ncbi:MAG TPA: CAAX protease [Treponema sp.]|nr:CAAX protease [Treponema sp.]